MQKAPAEPHIATAACDLPDAGAPQSRAAPWACIALLICATVVLYFKAVSFDFVNYDDPSYVTANARVQQGLSFSTLIWAFSTSHAGNWHPLTWLSHLLDWTLFGSRSGLHHLVNVLIHSLNTGLLCLVLFRLTGRRWESLAVAALFACHPMHVESVAWVSQRKDLLAACFMFLGFLGYERFVRCAPSSPSKRIYYGAVLACALLALLSKPTAVVFPFLLLLLDFWPLRRLSGASDLRGLLLEKVPFVALSVGVGVLTIQAQTAVDSVSWSLPFLTRLQSAAVAGAGYVLDALWPVNLSAFYPHPLTWPATTVLASSLLLLVVTIAAILCGRPRPYLLAGWCWFLFALAPVLGFIQAGSQFMADRYSYVSYVGIFLMISWTISEWTHRHPKSRPFVAAVTAAALLACSALAWRQLGYWHDSGTLFTHALSSTPTNYVALNNLGHFYLRTGDPEAARALFIRSLKANPTHADALNNLGFMLAREGRTAQARNLFLAALTTNPNLVEAQVNLGRLEEEQGNWAAAATCYEAAVRADPELPHAQLRLGIALLRLGRTEQARDVLITLLKLQPGNLDARHELERLTR